MSILINCPCCGEEYDLSKRNAEKELERFRKNAKQYTKSNSLLLTSAQIKMLISASCAYMAGEWGAGDTQGKTERDLRVLERALDRLYKRLETL